MARTKQATPTQTPTPAPASANTVIVALNRQTGILFSMPDGRRVRIAGNAEKLRGREKGILPRGAFGLTEIAAADWDYIQKAYGGMELIQNGLLFAAPRKADAVDMADDRADTRTGMEPVDPEETETKALDVPPGAGA